MKGLGPALTPGCSPADIDSARCPLLQPSQGKMRPLHKLYSHPRPYIKLVRAAFSSPCNLYLSLKRNGPENSACPCKKRNKRLEREGTKTKLFLSAAAEILSLHCRALSSITNLSRGLDGHRGALLALLALSASIYALQCK